MISSRQPAALFLLAFATTLPALAQTSTTPQQPPAPIVHRPASDPNAPAIPKPRPVILHPPPSPAGTPAATGPTSPKPAISTSKPATASTGSTTPSSATSTTPVTPRPISPFSFNRSVIVLDPGHGGVDGGSRIADSLVEKDVTLAFAFKLRSLLAARGFTVVMTREADNTVQPTALTLNDRAGIANHQRPLACLLLHATGSGTGMHLYTSELDAAPGEVSLQPWLTAQAPWVAQSRRLSKQISTALARAHVPIVASDASIRPVDSMTCPAVVLELAPDDAGDAASINDGSYQQHVAEAVAATLVFWKTQAQPPERILPTPPPTPAPSAITPATVTPTGAQP